MLSKVLEGMIGKPGKAGSSQQELAELKAYKASVDQALCVVDMDIKGDITHANDHFTNALGYAEGALDGKRYRKLVDRDMAKSEAYQDFWQGLKDGEVQSGTFELLDADGNAVVFHGSHVPVADASNEYTKVIAYLSVIAEQAGNSGLSTAEVEALNQTFGIMECDMNANILSCNALFVAPLGYSQEELVGKPITYFLAADTAKSPEYKAMWEKLNQGEAQSRHIKRIAKDKQEYWFQSNYCPIMDKDGKPYKVVIYSFCVTAEKLKTADFEGQLAAIDKIQGVIEFDLKGNITKVNDNFVAVTGYSRDEIVGQHHSMFVETAYKNSNEYKAFWDKLGRGEADAGEYRRVGKGGKEIWLQASYNPILDMNGKPFKVVKYATEITEQKLAAADNAGQLAAIDKIQGVIEFDLKGNITKVNDNFAAVTGYSRDEIVGKHHSMFVETAYKNSNEYKAFWDKLGRGEADAGEYQRVGKGGKEIWLHASYNPIMDMDGKPFKVVKYATDITKQHQNTQAMADAVAESETIIAAAKAGDLLNRISLEGKTGAIASLCDGINAILDKMTEVMLSVREAGETINTAAGEISTGNNDLSSRTEEQASSLEETASSMEELASTVKQNAENAKQANQLASAASGVAVKGGAVVSEVVNTMNAINESAKEIENIITVIDGIAFQTNILALNAAVEAARAGEQGRGFAVVAGEVRNLAQRSASAAKEIKELITDSVNKTTEGTKLVGDAGNTMQEIVDSVQRVTDIMGEISAASSEQSAGIDQVNTAITSMDETTQQNAALVEEAAAAAESLVDQAVNLMDVVNGFKLKGVAIQERRAPNSPMRAKAPSSSQKPAAKPVTASAKTGTDDADWEEF